VNVVCSFGMPVVTLCGDGGRTRSPTMLLFFRVGEILGLISGLHNPHRVVVIRVMVASLSSCEAAAGGQRAAKLDLGTWFKVGRASGVQVPPSPAHAFHHQQHHNYFNHNATTRLASNTIWFVDRA